MYLGHSNRGAEPGVGRIVMALTALESLNLELISARLQPPFISHGLGARASGLAGRQVKSSSKQRRARRARPTGGKLFRPAVQGVRAHQVIFSEQ